MPSPPRLPRAGAACWLAASLCALLLPPLACAQLATTAAGDKAALLEAKGAAETSACSYFSDSGPCPLNVSWSAATQPCGAGWEDTFRGWDGVECDASGGRVVGLWLHQTGVGGELLPFFGRLGALLFLNLMGNPALRGDVAALATLTELRHLSVEDCPLVRGDASALAALLHLGGVFTLPCTTERDCEEGQHERTGSLVLSGSGVHGEMAALRELPELPSGWSDFTSCSGFRACGASGLTLVEVRATATPPPAPPLLCLC